MQLYLKNTLLLHFLCFSGIFSDGYLDLTSIVIFMSTLYLAKLTPQTGSLERK
jgi:hypothetical protein